MKKCWIPLYYNVKDTYAMSELFEKLADKGWHFHKLYAFSALFIKGEKQSCRYTVDCLIPPRKQDDDENIHEYYEMCRQNGWEHIDGFGQVQVFKAIKGMKQNSLQSDADLEFDHVYKNEKSNLIDYIIVMIVSILFLIWIYNYNAKTYLGNDIELILYFMIFPTLILVQFLKICFTLPKIIKIKKVYLSTGEYKAKYHLLGNTLLTFSLSVFYSILIIYVLISKYLHAENIYLRPYYAIILLIICITKYFNKRNEGRQLKMRTHALTILICLVAYFFFQGLYNSVFSFNHPVDESRVIRMIDPDFEGTYTISSSFFIPYQCKFEIDSGNYVYELYIAKDLKTSELVFNDFLKERSEKSANVEWLKDNLEPLSEPYTVSGYYLNDEHKSIIVHIDNSILIIESNRSLYDPMVIKRFNEQLSILNLSYQ